MFPSTKNVVSILFSFWGTIPDITQLKIMSVLKWKLINSMIALLLAYAKSGSNFVMTFSVMDFCENSQDMT